MSWGPRTLYSVVNLDPGEAVSGVSGTIQNPELQAGVFSEDLGARLDATSENREAPGEKRNF